jgi:hypothetical protein
MIPFLIELGEKFNQDSVIFSEKGKNELIYTTGPYKGERNEGSGFQEVPDADNYYTDLKTPKGHLKSTLNFNFDTFVKALALVISWSKRLERSEANRLNPARSSP